jgi:hypothetical protein
MRPDFHLAREDRNSAYAYNHEHLVFERCILLLPGGARVPALIGRTSNNFLGPSVLEVMAEEHLRTRYALAKGDRIDVEVWIGEHAAAEAEAAMASHRVPSDDWHWSKPNRQRGEVFRQVPQTETARPFVVQ